MFPSRFRIRAPPGGGGAPPQFGHISPYRELKPKGVSRLPEDVELKHCRQHPRLAPFELKDHRNTMSGLEVELKVSRVFAALAVPGVTPPPPRGGREGGRGCSPQ